jgi:hypothetical protein
MKKITTILIIGLIFVSSLSAAAYTTKPTTEVKKNFKKSIDIKIDNLKVSKANNNHVSLELNGVSTFLNIPSEPRLPIIVNTVELPFGANNIEIEINPTVFQTLKIPSDIQPSQSLIPLTIYGTTSTMNKPVKNEVIYSSSNPYPNTRFNYRVTCGLNKENKPTTFLTIYYYPIKYIPKDKEIILVQKTDVSYSYEPPTQTFFPTNADYDLVIISPEKFSNSLEPLINHKNNKGIKTFLKPTEEIYNEYDGVDKPEQIKYFIKDARESLGITYVLLVGGLNSLIYAKPRDDLNQGSRDWHVPVRYTNLIDDPAFPLLASDLNDPGTISDLYYSDLYEAGGKFSSWDPNQDGVFAAWDKPGFEDDENLDFSPDVCLGRLACRNIEEVNTLVNKIITYETGSVDPSWFEKMIVVSGDGFLDQTDLNIQWDTNTLETGEYTIFAQSSNPQKETGPIESIKVTVDHSKSTSLHFNHDDHLRITGFPGEPIAEIVTVSDGDILGGDDFSYTPTEDEAYCNEFYFWANMSYINGILTIRGKSYDPKPYANLSNIHVWIENSNGNIVFEDWRNDTEMYYEGEWTTGEKALLGRGGALYYMPDHFEKEIIWASNGKYTGPDDIIEGVNHGCGFLFFSGHGSPNIWTDQLPGIPGGRYYGGIPGLRVTTIDPFRPYIETPFYPLDTMSNGEKLPIAVIGGCHNSQFNVSMVMGYLDFMYLLFPSFPQLTMWCYGTMVPETFSWRIVRNPNGGAIASMGNTGLGYGMPGKALTTGGGDGWITIEFFKQYGTEGHDILGQAYAQTLTTYINTFDMTNLPEGHPKTIEQWVLLGDPTLKIGGY